MSLIIVISWRDYRLITFLSLDFMKIIPNVILTVHCAVYIITTPQINITVALNMVYIPRLGLREWALSRSHPKLDPSRWQRRFPILDLRLTWVMTLFSGFYTLRGKYFNFRLVFSLVLGINSYIPLKCTERYETRLLEKCTPLSFPHFVVYFYGLY